MPKPQARANLNGCLSLQRLPIHEVKMEIFGLVSCWTDLMQCDPCLFFSFCLFVFCFVFHLFHSCFPGVQMKELVQFLTGSCRCPTVVTVKFVDSKHLPDPDTCFASVTLSTCMDNYEELQNDFDRVISFQSRGYGRS